VKSEIIQLIILIFVWFDELIILINLRAQHFIHDGIHTYACVLMGRMHLSCRSREFDEHGRGKARVNGLEQLRT